jgi:hypothetical protein
MESATKAAVTAAFILSFIKNLLIFAKISLQMNKKLFCGFVICWLKIVFYNGNSCIAGMKYFVKCVAVELFFHLNL